MLVGMEKGCLEVYMGVLPLHELAQQFSVTVAREGEFCQMGVFPWQTFAASALGDDCVYFHRQSTKILFKLVGLFMSP